MKREIFIPFKSLLKIFPFFNFCSVLQSVHLHVLSVAALQSEHFNRSNNET